MQKPTFQNQGTRGLKSQFSPGSKLFYLLRDYANNYYSILLMKMDLTTGSQTPKCKNESYRVRNSLSQAQIFPNCTNEIKQQQKIVELATINLIMENIKLSLELYNAKAREIVAEIDTIALSKLKFIPSSVKIMNYVKPQMLKRRFSKDLTSLVHKELDRFIGILSDNFFKSNVQAQHLTSSTITNIPMEADERDCEWIQVTHKRGERKDVAMDAEAAIRADSRKRKSNMVTSPNADIQFSVDLDVPSPITLSSKIPKHGHIVSETVDEMFSEYQTLMPVNQTMPALASPPDKPKTAVLAPNMSSDNMMYTMTTCQEINISSDPNHSLITIHHKTTLNIPKCHIALELSKMGSSLPQLDYIPSKSRFVYELLIVEDNLSSFQDYITEFVRWSQEREAPILFTLPKALVNDLKHFLVDMEMRVEELQRPFHQSLSTYTTT
jgi:hypothetical protein